VILLQWTQSFCSDILWSCQSFFYTKLSHFWYSALISHFSTVLSHFVTVNSYIFLRCSVILVNSVILLQCSAILLQCSSILWFCQLFSRSCQPCCYSSEPFYDFVSHSPDHVSHLLHGGTPRLVARSKGARLGRTWAWLSCERGGAGVGTGHVGGAVGWWLAGLLGLGDRPPVHHPRWWISMPYIYIYIYIWVSWLN
jgi:hypothetical protein